VITRESLIPLLVEASPTFAPTWSAFQAKWADQPPLPHYVVLGDFARHMVALLTTSDETTLKRIFAVIERLEVDGDRYVREASTIGLLEGLQNVSLHECTKPEQFERFLLPKTARSWKKVQGFWDRGEIITDD
jgi:hypothetical protein